MLIGACAVQPTQKETHHTPKPPSQLQFTEAQIQASIEGFINQYVAPKCASIIEQGNPSQVRTCVTGALNQYAKDKQCPYTETTTQRGPEKETLAVADCTVRNKPFVYMLLREWVKTPNII